MPEAQSPTSKGTPPVRRLPPAAASVKAKTGHPITPPPGFGYKTPASASSASSRHRSQAFKHQHNDLYTVSSYLLTSSYVSFAASAIPLLSCAHLLPSGTCVACSILACASITACLTYSCQSAVISLFKRTLWPTCDHVAEHSRQSSVSESLLCAVVQEARKNFRDAQDQMQRCKQDFYAAIKAGNRQKQQACSDQMEYWQQKLVEEKQKAHKKIFSKK